MFPFVVEPDFKILAVTNVINFLELNIYLKTVVFICLQVCYIMKFIMEQSK